MFIVRRLVNSNLKQYLTVQGIWVYNPEGEDLEDVATQDQEIVLRILKATNVNYHYEFVEEI